MDSTLRLYVSILLQLDKTTFFYYFIIVIHVFKMHLHAQTQHARTQGTRRTVCACEHIRQSDLRVCLCACWRPCACVCACVCVVFMCACTCVHICLNVVYKGMHARTCVQVFMQVHMMVCASAVSR